MDEALNSETQTPVCANCGEHLVGDYCHRCGEERATHRDLSVKHFFKRALQELVDVDHSKALRTMTALLFKPGHLTNEYFGGRRTRYLSPLKLFLTVFAISFLLYTIYKPVSVYGLDLFIEMDKTGSTAREVEKAAAFKKVEPAVFIERVDERIQRYTAWTQHVPVVMLSFFMIIIYWTARRYYVEHLIFSLHLLSFSYLLGVLFWPLMVVLGAESLVTTALFLPATYAYFFLALKRVYGESALVTAIKSLVLFGCYFGVVMVLFLGIVIAAVANTMRA